MPTPLSMNLRIRVLAAVAAPRSPCQTSPPGWRGSCFCEPQSARTGGLRPSVAPRLALLAHLLGVEIKIPDHTTFSRRGDGLTLLKKPVERDEPLHLLIDSTGLKMYGEGEWLEEKHGKRSRRRWRKLHLAIDANSHDVVAVELTSDEVGDVTAVPDLLDQIDGSVASVTGDGAYDADVVYDEITHRHPEADVIIPPRSTAVMSENGTTRPVGRRERCGGRTGSGSSSATRATSCARR